jgi:hypothetical protein
MAPDLYKIKPFATNAFSLIGRSLERIAEGFLM